MLALLGSSLHIWPWNFTELGGSLTLCPQLRSGLCQNITHRELGLVQEDAHHKPTTVRKVVWWLLLETAINASQDYF